MESFAKDRDAAVPDVLGKAWERAIEKWDDQPRHEEVMRLVAQHDAYAWAASRYRSRAGDPVADKQLERIRKAAEITMLSAAVSRKDASAKNPYRNTMALLIVLVVLIVGGLLYAWIRSRGAPEPTPPAIEKSELG